MVFLPGGGGAILISDLYLRVVYYVVSKFEDNLYIIVPFSSLWFKLADYLDFKTSVFWWKEPLTSEGLSKIKYIKYGMNSPAARIKFALALLLSPPSSSTSWGGGGD